MWSQEATSVDGKPGVLEFTLTRAERTGAEGIVLHCWHGSEQVSGVER